MVINIDSFFWYYQLLLTLSLHLSFLSLFLLYYHKFVPVNIIKPTIVSYSVICVQLARLIKQIKELINDLTDIPYPSEYSRNVSSKTMFLDKPAPNKSVIYLSFCSTLISTSNLQHYQL